MKMLTILITTLIFTASAQADGLSSCKKACFEAKQKCNASKGHTFNSCHDSLFTCSASCKSGKAQKNYTSEGSVELAFHPILDLDR